MKEADLTPDGLMQGIHATTGTSFKTISTIIQEIF